MSGVITAVGAGVGLVGDVYNMSKSSNAASRATNNAKDIQQKQDYYNQQLQQLIADPSSFFKSPIFTSALKLGQDSTAAQMAASGFNRSSNVMGALQSQAMSFGFNALQSQEKILAELSGAGQSTTEAYKGATGATDTASGGIANVAGGIGSMIGQLF